MLCYAYNELVCYVGMMLKRVCPSNNGCNPRYYGGGISKIYWQYATLKNVNVVWTIHIQSLIARSSTVTVQNRKYSLAHMSKSYEMSAM